MAAVESHEPGVTYYAQSHKTLGSALERGHPLGAAASDRLHQTSANRKLTNERVGDAWKGRRDKDRIVRRSSGHTLSAVAVNHMHVLNALSLQVSPSHLGQVGPSFNTCHE